MDISFASNKLKKQMESEKTMSQAFGQRAKPLRRRLRVLKAAHCLVDVPAGPPDHRHLLSGDLVGKFAVALTGNWRLVFAPDHDPVPLLPDGGIDLTAVTAVRIVQVIDYHHR